MKKKTREKTRRRKKEMCLFLFEFQIVLKKTEGGKLKGQEKNGTAEFSDLQEKVCKDGREKGGTQLSDLSLPVLPSNVHLKNGEEKKKKMKRCKK